MHSLRTQTTYFRLWQPEIRLRSQASTYTETASGWPYISLLILTWEFCESRCALSPLWLCGSIVAYPIIFRLVPSPSRFEIRQLQCWSVECEKARRVKTSRKGEMNGVSNVSLVFFGETAMHWIEETIKLSSLDFPWFCEILSVRVNFVASEINCFSLITFVSLLMPRSSLSQFLW